MAVKKVTVRPDRKRKWGVFPRSHDLSGMRLFLGLEWVTLCLRSYLYTENKVDGHILFLFYVIKIDARPPKETKLNALNLLQIHKDISNRNHTRFPKRGEGVCVRVTVKY